MNDKKPKAAWAEEPTPLTEAEIEKHDGEDSFQHYIDFARDLERRLRHAAKKLGAIRIDCMLDGTDGELDPELLEQMLGELEEVLST